MLIDGVVLSWQLENKLKNTIGVRSAANKNNPVKLAQRVEGRYEIDTTGGMRLQVLVFNSDFVVTKGLFLQFLGYVVKWRGETFCLRRRGRIQVGVVGGFLFFHGV